MDERLKEFDEKMDKAVDFLSEDLATLAFLGEN